MFDNHEQGKNSRALRDIFESMERSAARRRDLEETETKKAGSEACLCDGEKHHYIQNTPQGRKLAVCPHCNPRLSCQKCLGTGHLRRFNLSTLTDDLVPFGCDCTDLEKRVELFNKAQIPERYLNADFGHFDLTHLGEKQVEKFLSNQERVYHFCDYSHHLIHDGAEPGEKFFLTMMGPVGTGKTYLGVAALRRMCLMYGHSCRFIDFQNLLQQLRDAYSKRNSEEDILRPLRTADVLLIDEFGKGRTENEWQLEKLDDLVNSRYNARKVTLVTTNYLTPELLKEWQRNLPEEEKRIYLGASYGNQGYLPEAKSSPTNESFWVQSLPERIGLRMYDRMVEISLFVDFLGLPSLRKLAAQEFLKKHMNKKG